MADEPLGPVEAHCTCCYNRENLMIDFHTHIVPPEVKDHREDYFFDPLFRSFYSSPKAKLATAEDLIARMDQDGVEMSVALNIGWTDGDLCVRTNDYLMESVARHPRRLAGFGTVVLQPGEKALREAERCANGGLIGIGEMRVDRHLLEPDGAGVLTPFIQTIASNNLTLLVHASEPVGHDYPGKWDTTPDVLYALITRFPGLRLICAHWGGGLPFYALMPEVKTALSGIMFDTAASPYLYSPAIYKEVVEILGPDAILFGTDYPLLTAARSLKEIRSLALPAQVEEAILSGNAKRLLAKISGKKENQG